MGTRYTNCSFIVVGPSPYVFVPTLIAIVKGVTPHDGGDSFDKSPHYSDEAKARLTQHFSRIAGTLGFWKKQAEIFRRLHYYTLIWTIPASVGIPFLVQAIDSDSASKWLVTLVSASEIFIKNNPARHRIALQAIKSNAHCVAGILWDTVFPTDGFINHVVRTCRKHRESRSSVQLP